MLARTWRGATRADDAERYLDYLRTTGLADYARVPGHRRTLTLRRADGDRAEFLIVTLWDSMDAVRRFAGDEPGRAVFYPEDDRFLVARDDHVTHYEVVDMQPDSP
jgi:heme-degrading monooxygenase HmoA